MCLLIIQLLLLCINRIVHKCIIKGLLKKHNRIYLYNIVYSSAIKYNLIIIIMFKLITNVCTCIVYFCADFIQPICLPNQLDMNHVDMTRPMPFVVGWGSTQKLFFSSKNILQFPYTIESNINTINFVHNFG